MTVSTSAPIVPPFDATPSPIVPPFDPTAPPVAASRPTGGYTARVGMVGAGQLARMTHQAAIALGIEVRVLTNDPTAPAVLAGATAVPGDAHDLAAIEALAADCDVLTFDHELVPGPHVQAICEAGYPVRPGPVALALAQDKGRARRELQQAGFPVPAWRLVAAGDRDAVDDFARAHGWPLVLKAPTGGYDGRGVRVVAGPDELPAPSVHDTSWLLEELVDLECELSVLVARRPSGWHRTYPVIQTTQHDGVCRELVMPAEIPSTLAARACDLAVAVADGVDVAGILAVEMFVATDGRLLVNELAVRPHNSGHATLDACVTSQFENHLRGVLDWPLGDTAVHGPAAMVNLLGPPTGWDQRGVVEALRDPGVRVHLYGKQHRPGRKLGHVTALGETPGDALDRARRAAQCLVGR